MRYETYSTSARDEDVGLESKMGAVPELGTVEDFLTGCERKSYGQLHALKKTNARKIY
jgi:hypothetical protein